MKTYRIYEVINGDIKEFKVELTKAELEFIYDLLEKARMSNISVRIKKCYHTPNSKKLSDNKD